MGWRRQVLVVGWLLAAAGSGRGQEVVRPAFEVATIKLFDGSRSGLVGFVSYPGGRVVMGASTVKMIAQVAFDVDDSQIAGGPGWTETERFDVVALPPASSPTRTAKQPPIQATPSDEQRKMLQTLLAERFGLKMHRAVKQRAVYLLMRDVGPIHMEHAADTDLDARGGLMMKGGGIVDGEAFGTNLSMAALAKSLSRHAGRPVVDRTELAGTYDFHLPAVDPENRDVVAGVFQVVRRLGLKLVAGETPVETIVIDGAVRPESN